MSPERWQEVGRVFGLVADAPVAERDAVLAAECGDDLALAKEVRELLAADDDSDALQVVSLAVKDLISASGEATAEAEAEAVGQGQRTDLADLGMTVGDIIDGRYRIERVLGAGGMGVVIEATHTALNERVAMKLLRPQLIANSRLRERFLREAQAAAKLKSEYIVRVRDVGILDSGEPYMVMDMLDGADLAALLATKVPLPVEEAVSLILQACEALAAAHKADIVHRDIKPANLFLEQAGHGGVVMKLLDFGISKQQGDSDEALTGTGDIVGSPVYMSPEQLRASREVDARADIWSLGVVLYELLAGCRPFPASSLADLCAKVLNDPPLPIQAEPPLPPGLIAAVTHCLEKDREERFAHVAALAAALAPFAGSNGSAQASRVARTLGKRAPLPSFAERDVVVANEGEEQTAGVVSATTMSGAAAPQLVEVPARAPSSRGWMWGAAAAIAAVIVAIAVTNLGGTSRSAETAAAASADVAASSDTAATAPPTPSADQVSSGDATATASASAAASSASDAAATASNDGATPPRPPPKVRPPRPVAPPSVPTTTATVDPYGSRN